MNPAQLLDHFDRISDAPDAIPRLRRFILDLAVRGKLVEQDSNDEPASQLLGNRELSPNSDDEPWDLPLGWAWSSYALIGETIGGGTPSKGNSEFWSGSIPWVSPKDMKVDFIHDAQDHISELALENSAARLIPPGSLLMVVRGMILAHSFPTAISVVPVTINQDMKAIVPFRPDLSNILLLISKGMKPEVMHLVSHSTHGTCKLLTNVLFSLPLPIPPRGEQHRIVAKVDELTALCDRLEAAQAERERRRDRLTAASLQRLNETGDTAAFREHADFHLRHLARLTTRPDQVPALRETILNLAVRGQLVTQQPDDEPASELLERFDKEKKRLATEGKIKKPLLKRLVADAEEPFQLPQGWAWGRFEDVFTSVSDGDHLPPPKAETGIPFLVIGNVRTKSIEFVGCRHVAKSYYDALDDIRRPRKGDVLYTLVGSYGIPVIVRDDRPFCVQRHIGILRPSEHVDVGFLALALESRFVLDQATAAATGIAQKTVPLSGLRRMLTPVPPLAEQHRIVAKVDELMAVCDRLEAQLTTAQTESRRLLEAVLHDALAAAV